ncbi:MAG: hypothetical protein V7641_1079 [Blastocatellia bacterium]
MEPAEMNPDAALQAVATGPYLDFENICVYLFSSSVFICGLCSSVIVFWTASRACAMFFSVAFIFERTMFSGFGRAQVMTCALDNIFTFGDFSTSLTNQ